MNGVEYYDERPSVGNLTLTEILDGMLNSQKTAVLDGYAHRPYMIPAERLRVKFHISRVGVVELLYSKLDELQLACKQVMTGNYLKTAEVLGEENEVITPAEYELVPNTSAELLSFIQMRYARENTNNPNNFIEAEILTILTTFVEKSKFDGTGTWTFYKDNVKL